MNLFQKIVFSAKRKMLFAIRPFIGNRTYTKRYIQLLRNAGIDIRPYNECGFIATSVYFDKYDFSKLHIGQDVFLTHDVILLVHDQSPVTAWNGESTQKDEGSFYNPKDIYIGNNVFIGMRTVVLPGTAIGDDVVIGAGSVVKGDIPAGTVWAGNPAKMIQTTKEYRAKLERRGVFEDRDFSALPKKGTYHG